MRHAKAGREVKERVERRRGGLEESGTWKGKERRFEGKEKEEREREGRLRKEKKVRKESLEGK